MTGISAVVATYKRSAELKRLFDSLLVNKCPQLEVIIVDQNQDGLIDGLIIEYNSLLDIQHIKMNYANQSKARNIGAAKAKYDILCFPDDDCWFNENALNGVNKHFDTHPNTDLLVINWQQNPRQPDNSSYLTSKEIFSFRSVGYVTYVLFFKTTSFRQVGGFNENMGLGQYIGGGEDTEITFRLAENGRKIYYDKEIGVNHKHTNITNRDLSSIRSRERAMGFLYALYKIPGYIIGRGFISPIIRMFTNLGSGNMRSKYYNIFLARVEGYKYCKKLKDLQEANKSGNEIRSHALSPQNL